MQVQLPRLALFLRGLHDAVIVVDAASGRVLLLNPSAAALLGYPLDQANELTLERLFPTGLERGEFGEVARRSAEAASGAGGLAGERSVVRQNGELLPVEVSLTHLGDPVAGADYLLLVLRDRSGQASAKGAGADRDAATEEQLRALLEAIPAIIWMATPDGICTYVNQRGVEFTGLSIQELVGYGWVGAIHPDERARCLADYHDAVRQRRPRHLEYRLRDRDGNYRWVLDTVAPRYDPDGSLLGFVGSVIDITDRHEAEQAVRRTSETLARERELLQGIIDTIPVMIVVYEPYTTIVRVNPEFERVLGWPNDAARGVELLEACIPSPTVREQVLEFFKQSRGDWLDLESTTRDGRVVATTWAALRLSDNRRVGIGLDIEDRQRAELAHQLLADAGAVLASSLDYSSTVRSAARLALPRLADWCVLDLRLEDGSLRRLAVAVADPALQPLAAALEQHQPLPTSHVANVIRTGLAESTSPAPANPLGEGAEPEQLALLERLGCAAFMTVPLVSRGAVLGALSLVSSAPARRYDDFDLQLAAELGRRIALAIDNASLYRRAQEAIQLRDEFLSIASHELRTPLTSVQAHTQLLQRRLERGEGVSPEQLRRSLRSIGHEAGRLGRLIAQLLDVTRINTGRIPLQLERLNLVDLAANVVQSARARANQRAIVARFPERLEVVADAPRVEQVLVNLLDNAVKFSPADKPVLIEVARLADGGARVAVRDFGQGIPPEQREGLFQRYHQAHGRQHLSGLGLGLYISRQIAELHGGRLRAEFPEDGGSRFILELPPSAVATTHSVAPNYSC